MTEHTATYDQIKAVGEITVAEGLKRWVAGEEAPPVQSPVNDTPGEQA